jgi:hypothetical protein
MPLYYLVKTLFFYNIVLNVIEQSWLSICIYPCKFKIYIYIRDMYG